MTGYRDATEHLIDHLVRISLALDRLAAARDGEDAAIETATAALAGLDRHIAERVAATSIALPLVELAHRFELGDRAVALLVAAAVAGIDVGLALRWQALVGCAEPERRVHELVDLVAVDDPGALLAELAPLQQGRLIRLASPRDWTCEAPLLQRVATVPECVIGALRGDAVLDRELALVASAIAPAGDVHPELGALIAARARRVVVVGAALVGKATAIATAAAAVGRRAIAARLDVIAAAGDGPRCLAELACQARLRDDVLVIRAGDGIDQLAAPLRRAVLDLVESGGAVLAAHDASIARWIRGATVVGLAVPPAAAQVALWRARLGDTTADLDAVVARCSLPTGDILEAAATLRPGASTDDVLAAARGRLQHRLRDVASITMTTLAWGDLVVREDTAQRIFEIVAAVQYRSHVLETWGFAAKLPYGRAVSALLSGPPGTGKTMVAMLIAKELGLELFRVDLSKVVSKWLGETEKNLGKVFDEAARIGAVLLFDEADALFGKRTDVKSSNDRNANLEVNYLLQRLEQHDGVVLLTTNLASSIDAAFRRRLRFCIEFPRPEAGEREALWRAMLPPRAPLADDVDLAALAQRFAMPGGHIKNALVRAAFLAAERGARAIDHATLLHAATLEWTELGNLPT